MVQTRKIIPIVLLIFLALVVLTSGCVTDTYSEIMPEITIPLIISPNHDAIVGAWVTENYTSTAGVTYTKVVDIYYENNTMKEYVYREDGSVAFWPGIWTYNTNGSYDAYYAPFTMVLSSDPSRSKISCDYLGVDNLRFIHADNKTGAIGVWINEEPYDLQGGYRYFRVTLNEDGTGIGQMYNESIEDAAASVISWVSISPSLYVFTVSDTIHLEVKKNDRLYDNFGSVYTRTDEFE